MAAAIGTMAVSAPRGFPLDSVLDRLAQAVTFQDAVRHWYFSLLCIPPTRIDWLPLLGAKAVKNHTALAHRLMAAN